MFPVNRKTLLIVFIISAVLMSGCVDRTGHQHREKNRWYYETIPEQKGE